MRPKAAPADSSQPPALPPASSLKPAHSGAAPALKPLAGAEEAGPEPAAGAGPPAELELRPLLALWPMHPEVGGLACKGGQGKCPAL